LKTIFVIEEVASLNFNGNHIDYGNLVLSKCSSNRTVIF